MNPRFLIDGIVHQTTVLIAQLSTAAGARSPLAHVADQVFRDLARAIESQGVGRKVVADMFGMALRSYQTKLQRLEASASHDNRTLWQAVFDYVSEAEMVSRAEIDRRFYRDGELAVGAVLHDLTASGLVYCTGKGAHAMYRVTSEPDRLALSVMADLDTLMNLVWVHVHRNGPTAQAELEALWPSATKLLPDALARLESESRVARETDEDGTARYRATQVLIPVGSTDGWEGAVLDHFQAMAKAIAHKLSIPRDGSELATQVGGATLTFDVHEGHPLEKEVRGLLHRVREDVDALWRRVEETNHQAREEVGRCTRITFYFGQNVEEDEDA